MALDVDAEYVSVPEAARLLGVSPSTIWRWIDRGDLPASRVGRRRIRIARVDLTKVINPARPHDVRVLVPRLTPEERERAWRALEEAQEFGRKLSEKYGPFSDSTELLREIREARSRHLANL